MSIAKHLFVCLFILGFYGIGWAQKTYKGCYGFDCGEKKWSLSFFAGVSLLGPGQDITNGMKDSGLGDTGSMFDPKDGPLHRVEYPIHKTGMVWNIEAMYALSKKSGLQLTAGRSLHSSVEGYDRIGNGNYLRIKTDLWTAAFDYVWRLRKGRDGLSIGPVIASHRTSVDYTKTYYSTTPPSSTSSIKAGFNIGYSLSLIQKKSWFLSLKANYTWLPAAEIGPYTVDHEQDLPTPKPITYTSTFNKTNVHLSTINFGLSTGWRF